jgi:hypothetical protein
LSIEYPVRDPTCGTVVDERLGKLLQRAHFRGTLTRVYRPPFPGLSLVPGACSAAGARGLPRRTQTGTLCKAQKTHGHWKDQLC